MITKMRSDCALASLSPEQREDLYDLFASHSYAEVQEIAAKPADQGGFGLKIHRTTLHRFIKKHRQELHARELADAAAATPLNGDLPAEIKQLHIGIAVELAHATYELARAAHEPATFDRVQRASAQFENAELRRQQLQLKKEEINLANKRYDLDKRNSEYNIARELMVRAPEYMRIYSQDHLDNEDKVWAARDVCFGDAANIDKGGPIHRATAQTQTDSPAPVAPLSAGASAITLPESATQELPQPCPSPNEQTLPVQASPVAAQPNAQSAPSSHDPSTPDVSEPEADLTLSARADADPSQTSASPEPASTAPAQPDLSKHFTLFHTGASPTPPGASMSAPLATGHLLHEPSPARS